MHIGHRVRSSFNMFCTCFNLNSFQRFDPCAQAQDVERKSTKHPPMLSERLQPARARGSVGLFDCGNNNGDCDVLVVGLLRETIRAQCLGVACCCGLKSFESTQVGRLPYLIWGKEEQRRNTGASVQLTSRSPFHPLYFPSTIPSSSPLLSSFPLPIDPLSLLPHFSLINIPLFHTPRKFLPLILPNFSVIYLNIQQNYD